MVNWFLFFVTTVAAYVFISAFGQLGGGAGTSTLTAILSAFKPVPFVLLIVGNVLWGLAVFYGLQVTTEAIPIALAFGVITSFIYAAIFMGAPLTFMHVVGAVVVVIGVYLLR